MLLQRDKEVFQELVIATASDLGLENFQVEKDYYVSLFLKALTKLESNISIVFKGTSLSKCNSIIDRFSEDIDLALQFKSAKVTPGERKHLKNSILEVINILNMTLLNEEIFDQEEITTNTILGMPILLMEMVRWCHTSLLKPLLYIDPILV